MSPDTLVVLGLACGAAGVIGVALLFWLEARAARHHRAFKRNWDRWQGVR